MDIKSVKRVYWHILDYSIKPKELIMRAETVLTDPPYYKGKGLAFRAPFTKKALVIGWWIGEYTFLYEAFGVRPLTVNKKEAWETIRFGEHNVEEKTAF